MITRQTPLTIGNTCSYFMILSVTGLPRPPWPGHRGSGFGRRVGGESWGGRRSAAPGVGSEVFHELDECPLVLVPEFPPVGVTAVLDEVRAHVHLEEFLQHLLLTQ